MANPKLKFYFREPTIDTNIPITDGTVKIEGFDWEFVPDEDAADAWDCGFAARVRAFAKGCRIFRFRPFPTGNFAWLIFLSTAKPASRPRKIWKAGASVSCSGTTPPGFGRAARCSIITAWI